MTVHRTLALVDVDGERLTVERNDSSNGDELPFTFRLNGLDGYVYATADDLIEFGRSLVALGEAEQYRQTRRHR